MLYCVPDYARVKVVTDGVPSLHCYIRMGLICLNIRKRSQKYLSAVC